MTDEGFEIEVDDESLQIQKQRDLLEKQTTEEEIQKHQAQVPEFQDTEAIDVDVDGDEQALRLNSVLLQGVDDLSTKNVEKYLFHYCPEVNYTIEWVNDSALNVVCSDEDSALKLLSKISEDERLALDNKSQLHKCKPYSESTVILQCRISFKSDQKVRNARAQSRYYLHYGEPGDELRSRFSRGARHSDRGYGRDQGERRQRSRSRSRSPLSRMRNIQGQELFPEKVRAKHGDNRDKSSDHSQWKDRGRDHPRARSPPRRDLASRLDNKHSKWIKGDLLDDDISDRFQGGRSRNRGRRPN